MRQLDQRVAVRFHIHALSHTETASYVAHRLRVAGADDGIAFTRRALTRIYQASGGLPRRVNLLCDRALMTAYVHETRGIDGAIVRQSVRDLNGGRRRGPYPHAGHAAGGPAGAGEPDGLRPVGAGHQRLDAARRARRPDVANRPAGGGAAPASAGGDSGDSGG